MTYVPIPDVTDLTFYLGDGNSWSSDEIGSALDAEQTAQAAVCRVPVDLAGDIPADLAEALRRRVARNLAMKSVPLGTQFSADGFGFRVGHTDPEIRRFEAPYRKRVVG